MNKFYKMMFFSMLMLSSLITISSYSWLMMWMGIEINLMSMIPLMMKKNNILSSESMMKYFIIQSLASTLLMFSILIMEINMIMFYNYQSMMMIIFQSSLIMKLGLAPFQSWLVEVMSGLTWMNCLIMLTWQKVGPMIMLMMTMKNSYLINLTIIMSSLISGIQGLNQISLRKIMAYSSINHMSWMMISFMSSSWTWTIYFIVYSLSNLNLILFLNKMNFFYINQINSMNNNKMLKMMIMMNFLSMSGLPPMIGFLPKWLTINYMIINNSMLLTFILIISTLMHIYFYIRIIIPSLTMKTKEPKIYMNQNFSTSLMFMNLTFLGSLPICYVMF
uniref:NADH-ubiquinone oxidoreductase chain 2 n=1 Tax=Cassida circumdata TaxID=111203 RepID=A0A343L7Q3_9CUCU|nr:NADH dehydrogenase subunit 2 [Cassida circumdata]